MGEVDTKDGSSGGRGEVAAQRSGRPRSSTILERLSGLLHKLGVVERASPRGSAAATESALLDAHALRQRLTPPDGPVEELPIPPLSGQARREFAIRRDAALAAPEVATAAEWCGPEVSNLPWPGERAEPEWKPILLVPGEGRAGAPSIEELTGEDD